MKTQRWVNGLNNSQKIRVICDGVGFYTTVRGAFDMCFAPQRAAVTSVLMSLGWDQQLPLAQRPTGKARRERVYDYNGQPVDIEVQIDLL